ncbi:hypothetical protein LOZ80_31650 [Paenibacillus sp. HWE-109]|uniref:hypothetical protein n=1 Tax=Paenibacillus sp. HWE-109 TaxID=1306526 RepID=UPI001EDE64AA|nr:hypothetical protein [Paenibacillus sp. HWE-109]UKS26059.1 hypothetical protein LOZ80_31650 [Paenibacillus sp. HWE-109]
MYFRISALSAGIISFLYAVSMLSSSRVFTFDTALNLSTILGVALGLSLFNFFIALLKTYRTEAA